MATQHLQSALELNTRTFGAWHVTVGMVQVYLARQLRLVGDFDSAKDMYKAAKEIMEQAEAHYPE